MNDDQDQDERPESLLPYDQWTEQALRHVVVRAVEHVAATGLPGEHHFYITFRTDHAGTVIPNRLRAQYPQEMTIVLQHQFWDLGVDHEARTVGVALSFSGVPATLRIPLDAIVAFADPAVRFGLRFAPVMEMAANEDEAVDDITPPTPGADEPSEEAPQVVSLDAFRRRSSPAPKE